MLYYNECSVQIYLTELERVPEFGGFKWIETFPLSRGKQNEEEEDASLRTAAKFKVRETTPDI